MSWDDFMNNWGGEQGAEPTPKAQRGWRKMRRRQPRRAPYRGPHPKPERSVEGFARAVALGLPVWQWQQPDLLDAERNTGWEGEPPPDLRQTNLEGVGEGVAVEEVEDHGQGSNADIVIDVRTYYRSSKKKISEPIVGMSHSVSKNTRKEASETLSPESRRLSTMAGEIGYAVLFWAPESLRRLYTSVMNGSLQRQLSRVTPPARGDVLYLVSGLEEGEGGVSGEGGDAS